MRDTTRNNILNIARIVFARKGANNTTMDDVARASGLGRRTIYTYFRTREELYHEVIENEVERILKQLSRVAYLKLSPEKKIVRFMSTHMKAVKNLISKDHLLRDQFLCRSEKIENYRKVIDSREKDYLASIFEEGTQSGVFIVEDFANTAAIALTALKGLEREFILDNFGKSCHVTLALWQKILFWGIKTSA